METTNQKQQTITRANDDSAQAAKVGIIATGLAAASMGVWGLTCLVSGVASTGLGGAISGFMTAITGM